MIFTNARVVLPSEVVCGTVEVRAGRIADVQTGRSNCPSAQDLDGDYLLPGIVELHTDNFERHINPRPNVRWPSRDAIVAHDAQIAAAGITTVFDAISIGDLFEDSPRIRFLDDMVDAIRDARVDGALRAEHLLHLRCELTFSRVVESLERLSAGPLVSLVSIMDHSPGQRQFADVAKYRAYYKGKHGLDEAALDDLARRHVDIHQRLAPVHRARLVALCRARGIPMASHDDETEGHVAEAASEGMVISEFPTTVAAARAARD
jgi:alpha-D-ribose 1-methylphosphonate 5-triphosphate diphosphatase